MALSITSNYVGFAASEFITPALLNATTLSNEYVTVWTNVKYKFNILLGNITNPLQADSCSFTANGTVSLTESVLTPDKIMVNLEVCKTTLESHWESEKMRAGALNSDLTPTFFQFVTSYTQKIVSESIERLIWMGKKTGSTGIYAADAYLKLANGLFHRAISDSNTRKITGTSIDGSNAATEIGKVYSRISDKVFDSADLKIFVPRQIYRAYQQSLTATFTANSNFDVTKPQMTTYLGIPLVMVGLANNKMIAATKSNLHIGMDLTSDEMEYQVIDMQPTTGDKNVRIIMRFSLDTNVTNGDEIVVYGSAIA